MLRLNTATRTALMQAIVAQAGTGGKLKLYNGAIPAALGGPAGVLLATLSYPAANIGAVASGVLTFGASPTQTNGSHVNGTPTFLRVTDAADVAVADIELNGTAPTLTYTGTVVNGQNVTLTSVTWTAPHA